ncbi:type III secretion system stator protein SctL [Pseudomonas rhodesiae]|uniref:type III secretion system stator protein SctL n=1 Tax=Pseudomonas rhodesiae TaxID=76760 RepID=UPI000B8BCC60|nr:type III secretion system stator protein SctL [Pseudomonas rhodesiae]OXS21908.1 type III secretion protein [Pseudomonas fluorescens]OZO48872.1 type III secretion protein [Pseudomonas fluorescens]QVN02404.1 type III secretion system stator protein SctL [Pseudomonas rhodesiae]TGY19217.1 HrpE/YscL family type III secretion apparatus protein [Pseudomonas fluorescens]WLG40255.1 type III secretion system stator protein SctL [Pseudomonas rhodesiae]
MLQLHKIELHKNSASFPTPLVPREILADVENASQLLMLAQAEADELIRQANEKCEAMLKKASVEIWQRANKQFKSWEREHEEMLAHLEYHATLIINQATKCIFDEAVEPQRLRALIKQLLASQIPQISATLLCCPNELEHVKQILVSHGATLWKLQPDVTVPSQTLTLRTDEGDFLITWNSMLDLFLKQSR